MKPVRNAALFALAAAFPFASVSADDTPNLHPLEAACVEYEVSGDLQTGTVTKCHRDYGYEQYEIQMLTMSIAGMSQSTSQHNITIGDTIYAFDLSTNTGTKTINPMYEDIVASMQNTSPEEMGKSMVAAMGFAPTGETETVAGETCDVYASPQLGSTCLTAGGLVLRQSVFGDVRIATSVAIGDGGDDANYRLHETVPITDGPDLSNILNQ